MKIAESYNCNIFLNNRVIIQFDEILSVNIRPENPYYNYSVNFLKNNKATEYNLFHPNIDEILPFFENYLNKKI